MGGNLYCLGKDVQRGFIMWPPPQGEVVGAKSASCHQSRQTARFRAMLPKFMIVIDAVCRELWDW